MTTPSGPAPVRLAATVAIVRDRGRGPEVLLTERPESMRFMAGATVFPGGAVAAADGADRWEVSSTVAGAAAAAALGVSDVPRPFCAARRRTAVLERYLEHRLRREAAVLAAASDAPATVDEVVARAYSDTPPDRHGIARFSALAHVEMLHEQGRVERVGDRWLAKYLN